MNRMTLEDYRNILMNEVYQQQTDSGEGISTSLIHCIVENELKNTKIINDPKVFLWKGFTKTNAIIELYGYDIDQTTNEITVFTGLFDESPIPKTITKTEVMELATRAIRFLDESISSSQKFLDSLENEAKDFSDLISELKESVEGIPKIKVMVFSNGILSSRMKRVPDVEKLFGIDIDVQPWDIQRIYSIAIETTTDYEDLLIDLTEFPETKEGLPCLKIPQDEETNFDCYLSVVPGKFLAKIYHDNGSQLLEGNVRSFLSTKTSVNKKIQYTIQKEPWNFFVYNNGIAVTAKKIEVKEVAGSSRIVKIQNMQIINGGQTTASLAYALFRQNADVSKVSVQMKLTVLKTDDFDTFTTTVKAISRSSNSQNKISDADFFSNSEFHTVMEKFSRKIQAPPAEGITYSTYWFYERAKGQYNQKILFMSASAQKQFKEANPKNQVISKTDFAKFYNSWKQKPDVVSKGASACFSNFANEIETAWNEENGPAGFNEVFFKDVVSIAILFKMLENEITINKQGEWYHGSYRANVITYALAIFFHVIQQQFPDRRFDLGLIWDKQAPSNLLKMTLINISQKVYENITDPNRPVQNVTQWCKREACWQSMQKTFSDFKLIDTCIKPYLISKYNLANRNSVAKKDQKLTNDMELLKDVAVQDKIRRWDNLKDFILQHQKEVPVSQGDICALDYVNQMCMGKGVSPSSLQCKTALDLWEKAESFGWK